MIPKYRSRNIRDIFHLSIWKTLRFNVHYFGLHGLRCPAILVARGVKLKTLGGSVVLPRKLDIGMIKVGFPSVDIFDYKYERAIWVNTGKIIFEGRAYLGQGVRVSNHGKLIIGDNVRINANSMIVCSTEIILKKDVLISWDVLIMDTDFHHVCNIADSNMKLNQPAKVTIGEHCWIGCRCLLLKGVTVSDHVVIAANSTVTKNLVEKNAIYGDRGEIISSGVDWDP